MKTSQKTLTGIILMLTLILCLAFGASAEETYTEGDYSYIVTDGKATITAVSSSISGDVVIPDTLGGYPVTSFIGSFAENYAVKTITIPASITEATSMAFACCMNLESIIVDDDNPAFSSDEYGVLFNKDKTSLYQYPIGNKRTVYNIPDTVTEIWSFFSFAYADNLKELTLSKNMEKMEDIIFCAGLEKVYVTSINISVSGLEFVQCPNLKDIYYVGSEKQWNEITKDLNELPGYSSTIYASVTVHYDVASHTHSYTAVTTPATCTANGQTVYTCSCNDTYTEIIPTTGHDYQNAVCTKCGDSKADDCSHMCHKSGFMGFIWKIVQLFWKLFKINPVCECGAAHY